MNVWLNEDGYYIKGNDAEISRRVIRSSTYDEHMYTLLCLIAWECRNCTDDINVYSDSKIIDELNGVVSSDYATMVRRALLSKLSCVFWFRKKSKDTIDAKVNLGLKMFSVNSNELVAMVEDKELQRKLKVLGRFRNERQNRESDSGEAKRLRNSIGNKDWNG